MRPLFHPPRRKLLAWLNGEISDPRIDAHLDDCTRCATRIEQLDDDGGGDISDALALVLQPPADLSVRLTERVTARLDSKVMFGLLSDLFGAGVETTRMLILEEGEEDE